MSMTVFVALCILGCDFLLYAFFQWTYGEKRRTRSRRKSAESGTVLRPPQPHVLRAKAAEPETRETWNERLAYHSIVSAFPPPRR
jgi:hypothetical protein